MLTSRIPGLVPWGASGGAAPSSGHPFPPPGNPPPILTPSWPRCLVQPCPGTWGSASVATWRGRWVRARQLSVRQVLSPSGGGDLGQACPWHWACPAASCRPACGRGGWDLPPPRSASAVPAAVASDAAHLQGEPGSLPTSSTRQPGAWAGTPKLPAPRGLALGRKASPGVARCGPRQSPAGQRRGWDSPRLLALTWPLVVPLLCVAVSGLFYAGEGFGSSLGLSPPLPPFLILF